MIIAFQKIETKFKAKSSRRHVNTCRHPASAHIMRVFIDANIYLNLISDSSEKKLEELERLVQNGDIKLIFPRITEEEVLRRISVVTNRYWEDNILKKSPNKSPLELSIIKKNAKMEEIESIRKNYISKLNELKEYYVKSVEEFKKRLKKLRSAAIPTPENNKIIISAENRKIRGNPPGGNKIGDDLVWEILLSYCKNDNLIIVSNDPDWRDEFRSTEEKYYFNHLLEDEWLSSGKSITLYGTLGEFLRVHAKIDISEKEIAEEKNISANAQAFPYTFPVAFSGSSGPSIYPSTFADFDASPSFGAAMPIRSVHSHYFGCNKCGEVLPAGAIFCPHCGTRDE
jgi:predicted nucleic acid-binding protein